MIKPLGSHSAKCEYYFDNKIISKIWKNIVHLRDKGYFN